MVAGCGGGGEPSVEFRGAATSTTFVTLPPPPSTTTPPATSAPAEPAGGSRQDEPAEEPDPVDPVTGNRLYEVQPNDYLLRIATRFDTTPEAIAEVNGWSSVQHNINPGDTIQIPPVEGAADSIPATESSDPSAQECPDGSEPETYTIQRGDIPASVAARFDVTVADLRAANVDTPNYNAFVVGLEINIPC